MSRHAHGGPLTECWVYYKLTFLFRAFSEVAHPKLLQFGWIVHSAEADSCFRDWKLKSQARRSLTWTLFGSHLVTGYRVACRMGGHFVFLFAPLYVYIAPIFWMDVLCSAPSWKVWCRKVKLARAKSEVIN